MCVRPRGHLVTVLLLLDHLEGWREKGTEGWSSGGKKEGGGSPAGDVDDEKEKCLFELRMEGLLQQRRER